MIDGLKTRHREAILQVLTQHPRVKEIILFGSRAMGTFTPTSDIDLALEGPLTLDDQATLADNIEYLTVPHTVDLVRIQTVTSPELLDHIKTHGVSWWSIDS